MKKYIVRLDADERSRLEKLVRTAKCAAYVVRHANLLLALDASHAGAKMTDVQAADAFGVSVRSIEYLRQRLVEDGLNAALDRRKQARPSVERIFDGEKEAKLIAIACSPKPEGRTRWTLELLADRAVVLKIVDSCSARTVGRVLKKPDQTLAA
ncbi:helix-turn-helix domain-containing protein [soil metagenome]